MENKKKIQKLEKCLTYKKFVKWFVGSSPCQRESKRRHAEIDKIFEADSRESIKDPGILTSVTVTKPHTPVLYVQVRSLY